MSTIIALVGPIEYWWNTEEAPDRFNSPQALNYRIHRQMLGDYLVDHGYLVYRPHEAFKGPWDERAQVFNDAMIQIADIVVNMRPEGIPGKGTDHELAMAEKAGLPIIEASPGRYLDFVLDDIKEAEFNASRV